MEFYWVVFVLKGLHAVDRAAKRLNKLVRGGGGGIEVLGGVIERVG